MLTTWAAHLGCKQMAGNIAQGYSAPFLPLCLECAGALDLNNPMA
jgi:hypothetical protein